KLFGAEYASVPANLSSVDDPRDAELINKHAERFGPESRLKRHLYLAILSERAEHAFALSDIVEMGGHAKPGGLRVLSRRRIGPLQYLIADLQSHVHNATLCFSRHVRRHRRFDNSLHKGNFPPQGLLLNAARLPAPDV